MFGVDLVTHGFREVFKKIVDGAVAKMALFVPDELHLPLPPHFASDAHLNMVVVKDGDMESGKTYSSRREQALKGPQVKKNKFIFNDCQD